MTCLGRSDRHTQSFLATNPQGLTLQPHDRDTQTFLHPHNQQHNMRRTLARLASEAPARYLTPNAPTGLTGLATSASPRSTLKHLYSSTLGSLENFPRHSVYRQATEAITRQRLAIVDSVVPVGYAEWQTRMRQALAEQVPELLETSTTKTNGDAERRIVRGKFGEQQIIVRGDGELYVQTGAGKRVAGHAGDPDQVEWDGEEVIHYPESVRSERTAVRAREDVAERVEREALPALELEPEPALTADQ